MSFGDLQLKNIKSIFVSKKQPKRLKKGPQNFNDRRILITQFKEPTVEYFSEDKLRK